MIARALQGLSMTRRLILSLSLLMGALWLLAVGLGLVVMEEELAEIFDGTLQDTAERLVPLVVDDLANRAVPAITVPQQLQTASSSGDHEYMTYQVRDVSGRVLLRSHDAPEKTFDVPLKAGFSKDDTYQFYTATNEAGTVFVQVADAFENREEALREGAFALFLPLALLIPMSGGAIWLVVRQAVRPVEVLRRDIETKDGGNMEPIAFASLPRELQPIAISVNMVMGRLRAALDTEREFTSNAANELRTPIAGALAQTQVLLNETKSDASHRRIRQIEASLLKLGHLAEKLLQLSRAEADIGMSEGENHLLPVLDMVLADFRRRMPDPERLVFHRAPGAVLNGTLNEDAFAIVARNLVENALLHGDPAQPIEIFLDAKSHLRIINGAPVLTAAQLAGIRKRFARGDTKAEGSGLGLSIVERLLDQVNGRLVLLSPITGRKEDGFEVNLYFG